MAELKLKKADIVLGVFFVIAAIVIFGWSVMYFTDGGNAVTVTADGNELGEYSLSENTVVVVKDGEIAGVLKGSQLDDALESTKLKTVIGDFAEVTLGNGMYEGDVNIAVIEDGKVYMDRAGCDNQHCVNHQKISRGNEQIVCLPNKVILQIVDNTGDSEVDIVAN